ncbi:hypothetical protein [Mesobacterium pallidum]|uniref:hypothetical protein n=1 Tax=Mesobacterium pallidum TaxID=2872037 RepID=UPI001EE18121|nr:hypothetical protein [Mesobacterium pallidum]
MTLLSFPKSTSGGRPSPDGTPPAPQPNRFGADYAWITFVFGSVMAMLAIASGYASFNGIQLFQSEIGGESITTKGTAVILTLSIVTILAVGWGMILKYAPEAPTPWLGLRMTLLGLALTALTLGASTTSNLAALVGPPSKVHAWTLTHTDHVALTNRLETSVLGIDKILPGWQAQQAEACKLAALELDGGVASGTGAGSGPVAANLARVCEQTKSFVGSMMAARNAAIQGVGAAQDALVAMRGAIRDRDAAIVAREDRFLDAGVALNTALQKIRASDLTDVMDAGAAQLRASVAELSETTAFSKRQAESVAGIKAGLAGLVASTELITARLKRDPIPLLAPITSPDLITAIRLHGGRFVPMVSLALALDLFPLWALMFLMTARAGAARAAQTARTRPTD